MKLKLNNINLIHTITAIVMVFSIFGCARELDELGNIKPAEFVCFTAEIPGLTKVAQSKDSVPAYSTAKYLSITKENWGTEMWTKATPLGQLNGKDAQVIGYGINNNTIQNIKFNQKFKFDGEMLVNSGSPIYWKNLTDIQQLGIWSYTPSDISVTTIQTEKPVLDYTVSENLSEQIDIAVATTQVAGNYRMSIPLQFEHIFTAIKFRVGFGCKVKSLTLSGVKNSGTYTFGDEWDNLSGSWNYKVYNSDEGVDFAKDAYLNDGDNTLMLLPQEFDLSSEAKVELEYLEGGEYKKITASLAGQKWEAGRMITYTILKEEARPQYLYLDLAAGDVIINKGTYSGARYEMTGEGNVELVEKKDEEYSDNTVFYVFQSTEATRKNGKGIIKNGSFISPGYEAVKHGDQLWSEYITNNNDVNAVIENWVEDIKNTGRIGTNYRIAVNAAPEVSYNLIIDNIYSLYQTQSQTRTDGGISFSPIGEKNKNCKLTITTIGDNRLGNIHYSSSNDDYGSRIIFEGKGSLTVADVDLTITGASTGYSEKGYYGNHYCAAIGGNDDGSDNERCRGIVINSGVLFAGSTVNENCSAIGGGGNGIGEVTINGGIVTAVAATTGTAIGGGIGYSSYGGEGIVTINGGNVYAYNLDNKRGIPSSAIGGAGSSASTGTKGTVKINGGNVYAFSALGTAIGGGSSRTKEGGSADVVISGGVVIAQSESGAGIGGGTGCSGGNNDATELYGGDATITISGSPVIRTGSIGGGKTGAKNSKIGSATINISGTPDIQAQFVMAKGAGTAPSFTMTGGTIRNSHTTDQEYIHIQDNGGAVYMEDGELEMTGGTITNCSAVEGGAIYITGGNAKISGTAAMTNNLASAGNGGAICIYDGNLEMSGSANVSNNASQHRPLTEGAAASGGNGGGIYVSSSDNATVSILQGTIKGNTADRNGGGIAVDMSANNDKTARITIGNANAGDTNPDISGNTSLILGGGLYASGAKADITINSGKIMDNSTSGYTYNVNVANEGGTVTLNGGNVTHQTVTFNANGGKINGADTSQQKIVTSTNSLLKAPEPTRTGYNFTGWNTRQDGNGTPYADGATMNLSADLTLYAQWKIIQ